MDSLTLYRSYFLKSKSQRAPYEERLLQINEVVETVFKELTSPPFVLKNSPFVAEIQKIIGYVKFYPGAFWQGRSIVIIDALGIISGVQKSFDKDYKFFGDDEIITSYGKKFFDDGRYQGEAQFIANIETDLNEIQDNLLKLKDKINIPEQENFQPAIKTPSTAPPVQISTKAQIIQNPITRQTAQPIQSSNKSSLMQDYAAKTNAQIEMQKYITATENERTKQLKIRRESNEKKIQLWNKGQMELMNSVKELQSPTQRLLEDFRKFSNNLTENYIVQFAKTQIELFNLIASNYAWHAPKAKDAQNKNYYKAVDNYKDYLDMIVDALAYFGVEEISSDYGTRFNGKIHDVKNTKSFYPQTATIKRSLRSGFKFGDLILQKEEVEV